MDKRIRKAFFTSLGILFLLFTACDNQQGSDIQDPPSSSVISYYGDNYRGPGHEVFHVNAPGQQVFIYTLDLGANTRDVYFIFTNTGFYDQNIPIVEDLTTSRSGKDPSLSASVKPTHIPLSSKGLRGKPEITLFNENPFAYIEPISGKGTGKGMTAPPPYPLFDSFGQKHNFIYDSTSSQIPATCRAVAGDGTKTLNIWVADDCWEVGGNKLKLITQTMVDVLQQKFLQPYPANDIYDWVSNIFGEEWGVHSYPDDLIEANNEITILLYDIDEDNSTNGGVLGFFWAKDNYKMSRIEYSNQRIMFYIDAVLFATEEGDSWDVSDLWPSEGISAMAHEFQHMIHFYQKAVLLIEEGYNTESWINELLSMTTEDIVSDKIEVNGPRGVSHLDGSAGSQWITEGRLPLYNHYNDIAVAYWPPPEDPEVLRNYSINYAFGAYLARNYGGAELMRNIVHNDYTDYRALESALSVLGYSESFATVLQKWAAANLLSDNTDAAQGYSYNTGTWFQSELGSITYNLGSINLYNYKYGSQEGPFIYSTLPLGDNSVHYRTSNLYFRVGSDLTGRVDREIFMGQNVKLTVVVKENP